MTDASPPIRDPGGAPGGPVAIVGCGMIGRSWAIAFARGGCEVRLHDPVKGAAAAARQTLAGQLHELAGAGLLGGQAPDEVARRVAVAGSLAEALDGAVHVQENAPETVELKRALFAELLAHAGAEATVASSSSALVPSAFLDGDLAGAERCLVAHPLNPPHLVPAVELVPGPRTDPVAMDRVAALMEAIGQRPILLSREVEGFVMNRLQGALMEEAFRLIADGTVSPEGVDRAVRDGLGLRWSFMGPIETIDLNAPGGVVDYLERYREAYRSIAASAGPRVEWDGALAAELERARRATLPESGLAARRDWRDARLAALVAHKAGFAEGAAAVRDTVVRDPAADRNES